MTDPIRKYALIVAGGSGTRMGAAMPKQFLLIKGKPVLMHTLEVFHSVSGVSLILVLATSEINRWKELCKEYSFIIPHHIVEGGDTRFHSVRNGLNTIEEDGLVAIHDGVRPLVSIDIINQSFIAAEEKGNAIACVKLKDSIREKLLLGGSRNLNRNNYFLIQTPQTFQVNLIKEAYSLATHYNFTDDAGVLEEMNKQEIHLIEGSYQNIKITTPEDLFIAEAFMQKGL
jgi:2-C-methyl-D-erythritol 4-phosphate cytidylyltransferase